MSVLAPAVKQNKYSGFSPQSISGLYIWSDAAALYGASTSGSPLFGIPNLAIYGGFSSVIGCNGYAYGNSRNGLTTVRLNSSTPQIWQPSMPNLTTYTLFWAGRQTGGSNQRVLTSNSSLNHLFGYWGGYKKALYVDGNPNYLTTQSSDTNWDLMSHTRTAGGAWTFNWNGTSLFTGTSSSTNGTNIGINILSTERSDCEFGEIIMYNLVLSTQEIQAVEGYLAWKWGMQANLPAATHPFFNYPPSMVPFRPTDLPKCVLWLDGADTSAVITSGSTVTQWKDKSPNANHSTSASGTLQSDGTGAIGIYSPVISGPIQNSGSSVVTVFVVARTEAFEPYTYDSILALNVSPITNYYQPGTFFCCYYGGTRPPNYYGFMNGNLSLSFGPGAFQRRFIFNVYQSGPSGTTYGNGTNYGATSTPGNTFIYTNYYIGLCPGGPALTGYIYEVIVYNSILTDNQRIQVEGYLGNKWGLTSYLGNTHSFFKGPPYSSLNYLNYQASVAFYGRNYISGVTWADASQFGRTATLENGTPQKGGSNVAVYFDGSTNWTFPNINLGNAWTCVVWCKVSSYVSGSCVVTQNYNPSTGILGLAFGNAGTTQSFGFYTNAWTAGTTITGTSSTWTCFTGVWNGSFLYTYVNGVLVGKVASSYVSTDSGLTYRIGRRWDGSPTGECITGYVGEIRIYSNVFSPTDVAYDYNDVVERKYYV